MLAGTHKELQKKEAKGRKKLVKIPQCQAHLLDSLILTGFFPHFWFLQPKVNENALSEMNKIIIVTKKEEKVKYKLSTGIGSFT